MPNAASAISAIAGLGIPMTKTYAYYTMPLKNVRVKMTTQAASNNDRSGGHTFEGQRQLGCLEKPLDNPQGSLSEYRMPVWVKNLQGY